MSTPNRNKAARVIQKTFRDKKLLEECGTYRPNISTIRSLLEAGANVNARDTDGNTPLIKASRYDNANVIRLLVEAGANVNARDTIGSTALFKAATSEYPNNVRVLIDLGANVNVRIPYGWSALALACDHTNTIESTKIVKYLVRAGADVNVRVGKLLLTPLMYAVAEGNTSAIRVLLRSGVNVHARDTRGRTALTYVYDNADKIIKLLLHGGANIEARDTQGNTPLIRACADNNPKNVRILLREGANINARNKVGRSALMVATFGVYDARKRGHIHNQDIRVLNYLLRAGANVNARDNRGHAVIDYVRNDLYLQSRLREKKTNSSARTIQKAFRKFKEQRRTRAAIAIQRVFRERLQPRMQRRTQAAIAIQRVFRERLQPRMQRRTQAAIVIQRRVRQLPRIKAARTIQSVVRRHRATNKNSRLSRNAITLEHIPRRNSIALNGQMYHRNSIASLVAQRNARVPHSRRPIFENSNGRYTTRGNNNNADSLYSTNSNASYHQGNNLYANTTSDRNRSVPESF